MDDLPSSATFSIDPLEKRQLFAITAHPVAINFNDEALFDSQFSTTVQEAKNLGVTSVRLWLSVSNWDVRPNVWDPVPDFGDVAAGITTPDNPHIGSPARVLKRAFELNREGFSVMIIITNPENANPAPPAKVQDFLRHLLSLTETPESTTTLADVVDFWEIGNEPDLPQYWKPSATDKTAGIRSYVNDFLIPAADVLHDPANGINEMVVSAGPSWSPNDLKLILDELAAKNRLDAIDFAGYHPYGEYNPSQNIDVIGPRTALAKQYADAVGKPLIATEWNVRGYGTTGANDDRWAAAADEVYRTIIQPNYFANYYFALVNNWAARGGTISARPGGVLKHDSPVSVTPSSPTLDLREYYNSPLVHASPFYEMYNAWQYGSISGVLTNSHPHNAPPLPQARIYVDKNNNGRWDEAEPYTFTNSDGTFTLTYSTREVTAGYYFLRVVTPAGWLPDRNAARLPLANLSDRTGVALSLQPQPQIRTVTGVVFDDANNDGVRNGTEGPLPTVRVWLDLDGNGFFTDNEPSTLSSADGTYTITYDALVLPVSTAALRAESSDSKTQSTTPPQIDLMVGGSGLDVGLYTPPLIRTVTGVVFDDANNDGVRDGAEGPLAGVRVWLDLNNDGVYTATEPSALSSADGTYTISYDARQLAVSAATLRVQTSGSTTQTTPSPLIDILGGGTGLNFGLHTPPRPPATGSISGVLWNDSNANGLFDNNESVTGSRVVFIDANQNGKLDAGEKQISSDANGVYKFTDLPAGTYYISRTFPSGYRMSNSATGYITVTLAPGQNLTGIDIGTTDRPAPTPTPNPNPNPNPNPIPNPDPNPNPSQGTLLIEAETGTRNGVANQNNHSGYTGAGFADYGGQGTSVEWRFNWASAGTTTITFRYANGSNAARPLDVQVNGMVVGSVACAPTGSWTTWGTVSITVDLTAGSNVIKATASTSNGGANLDSLTITPGTSSPPSNPTQPQNPPTTPSTGTISGYTFNDSNANGKLDASESKAGGKVVFLDTNNNGKLDAGEKQVTTDANGAFTFTGLAPGTYYVRRVFPNGYTYSTPLINVTLSAGQTISNLAIGSRYA